MYKIHSLKETNNNLSKSNEINLKNSSNNHGIIQKFPKPLQTLIAIRKNILKNIIALTDNLMNEFYTSINRMHWRLFKSNVEKLDKILGKEIYVEKLQPLYINKTIGKEYDIFLNILHRYQKDNEIMKRINKVDSTSVMKVISSKRTNNNGSVSSRKGQPWLLGEDYIIIREREININDYATRVAKVLEGRSEQSIINRWNQVLKNQYKPNNTTSNDNDLVSNDDMKDTKKRTNDEILPII
jgi:hypothetical protein